MGFERGRRRSRATKAQEAQAEAGAELEAAEAHS
jgi:hypothetical protein